MKYTVEYLFKGQILFKVVFEGEEWLPDVEVEGILEEKAEIMRGSRIGIVREVKIA